MNSVIPEASTVTPDPRAKREAAEAFEALMAERHILHHEVDPAIFDESYRDGFYGHYLELKTGKRIYVSPAGQDPVMRLTVARSLLAHQGVTA
ncbi:hypothetical protein [Streptomyces sp. NBC_01518]|uniref:hypothetical protein n=1 Tax=Streptomyces sp. NBC_01518 TaxID=2903891 RepID=UPI003868D327